MTLDYLTIVKTIYKSKYSVIYKCKINNKFVIVKQYDKPSLKKIQNYINIRREINIMSKFSHFNMIKYINDFEKDKTINIIQEYCEYGDLSDVLNINNTLPEYTIIYEITLPLISVLSYLHSNNIIHRDIKPENIFVTKDGVIKLGDFGFAIDTNISYPVERVGTLDFMAPEVLKIDIEELSIYPNYDNRVDIWSFGILLYELAFGYVPFEDNNRELIFEKNIISNILENIIRWMLTYDYRKRPYIYNIAELFINHTPVKPVFLKKYFMKRKRKRNTI